MYTKKELPYAFSAFEPKLSAQTLYLHDQKIYAGYVERLNVLLEQLSYDGRYDLKELVSHIDIFDRKDRGQVLFLLGGVLNHELYFDSMGVKMIKPSGKFLLALEKQYGSVEHFIKEFSRVALNLVGSGYTFLVVDQNKELNIVNMSNQETPYTYNMTPILALDLWEHSYYLDDYNNKSQYLSDFISMIDFQKVGERYEKAL